eukprot:CAMPEP_0181120052 /NCGR_PEP_ID=MMETSP1071-20121207/23936_1 /TAXON_ID=35127 /ORGANISM="Thalassiosira sp., Strain NH16" /LENGTH=882 /DNA_ID=CAMNT_0023204653 /DNA_START=215 /DNA_END=2863 /DNA_ORIENTATION=+
MASAIAPPAAIIRCLDPDDKKISTNVAALDLSSYLPHLLSSDNGGNSGGSDRSVSNRSVRRRDVIRPLEPDEMVNSLGLPLSISDSVSRTNHRCSDDSLDGGGNNDKNYDAATADDDMGRDDDSKHSMIGDVDVSDTCTPPSTRYSNSDDNDANINNNHGGALVLHPSAERRMVPHVNDNNNNNGIDSQHGSRELSSLSDERRMIPHGNNAAPRHRSASPPGSDGAEHRFRLVSTTATATTDRPSSSRSPIMGIVRSGRMGDRTVRGVEPPEAVRDRSLLLLDGDDECGNDPPGESPNDRPVCLDLVLVPKGGAGRSTNSSVDCDGSSGASDGSGGGGYRRVYRSVRWVDPKTVKNASDVDHSLLKHYEELVVTNANHQHDEGVNSNALVEYDAGLNKDPPASTLLSPHQQQSSPIINTPHQSPADLLLSNPRMRIATVSSGYKKANYFVREDLDTRIYFHQLEDAVGYMAKRGYMRMRREEEGEWRELLQKAHGVVKVGPKKEKQRYRKGKLVLILKKIVTDDDVRKEKGANNNNKKKRSKPKNKRSSSSSRSDDASSLSGSHATQSTYNSDSVETQGTAHTDRTSLGKTVRGSFKSYSEKFLAQQEDEKRRYLLAIVEGRPLDNFGYNAPAIPGGTGGQLLLTDGSTMGAAAPPPPSSSGLPADPDADATACSEYGESRLTSFNKSDASGWITTTTEYTGATTAHETDGTTTDDKQEEFNKSRKSISSGRRGVYGGGVRYFTPEKSYEEDDEESEDESEGRSTDDDEDFEEEEEDYAEEDDTEDYTATTLEEDGSSAIEIDNPSDMGSMFSDAESSAAAYDHHRNAGVESVTSESTETEVEKTAARMRGGMKNSRRRSQRRDVPRMTPVSDDSASSSSSR